MVLTLTEHTGVPIPGIKKGKWSGVNGDTSSFGFNTLIGVVMTVDSDNDAIVSLPISGGSGTMGLRDDEGNAVSATTTGYYWAWGE